ncbi:adenylosuccinate lyase [Alicyclobacillus cycloheptanicus]|uniref:Adenylosuccinate lyase n=1 Tax=Alicyclobacillus cycloheptanicus TaxID=1457 RepID=A0ABT9XN50_9BACL|nr:adenylosuccinate lyase [Alicyclobacillus cycloheptanicus]MDQ0191163.1 adenylosuccinate lyase [Alicyclobacillus cycloheptanicus]WDM02011.1 adenylosuccinate lyase [Alicyclobacillus cycloheptanicus]
MIDRYTRPEMGRLWTLEQRFHWWLQVEILASEAWAELGVVPRADAAAIREKARFDVHRVLEIEQQTRHDVVAFTRAVSESLGPERKWVHYGLTSTDVVDTALSAQLQEAVKLIRADLQTLLDTLKQLAGKHRHTLMMGRTHGVHAEPTTFGLKVALWYAEMIRNLERFDAAAERVRYGKISGAVGTYANVDPFVEQFVCERLGLKPALISAQTLQRDRHAEFVFVIGLIGTTLDKIATEIRALQKSEVRELEEPFYQGQKGSSAMPHKRNPVSCEQVSGLARVLRGYVTPAMEDVVLWHERDISHSSVERIILPDATILIDYMLNRMNRILSDLRVYPENMKRNMDRTFGLTFSQRVLTRLIEKGVAREEAYDTVQPCAMQAWEEGRSFYDIIQAAPLVREHLTEDELKDCFDPSWHLKHVDTILERFGI